MITGSPWTDARTDRLRHLIVTEPGEWSFGKLAIELNTIDREAGIITRNGVASKITRLGTGPKGPLRDLAKSRLNASKTPPAYRRPPRIRNRSKKPMLMLVCEPLEPLEPYIATEGVTLVELTERSCRWPMGDPRNDDFRFCGHSSPVGQSYCEHHRALAYGPGTRSERLASKLPRGEALAAYADQKNAA